jgi:hypothetical protein
MAQQKQSFNYLVCARQYCLWALGNLRDVYVAAHPQLGDLSSAVLVASREAASAVEAVGAFEAA